MSLLEHNRDAWNHEVAAGNRWTVPVGADEIAAAREGRYIILLTPYKPVPADWLEPVADRDILCLASGGGQQGPLLAAAGGRVTVFDNSDAQIARDEEVAAAHGLQIRTVRGNMQDLGAFADDSFDLIVHPVSNCFIDDILPVWREAARVLRPGGRLLAAFNNPIIYMIDWELADSTGRCVLIHAIPYSDTRSLSPEERAKYEREHTPLEFGHSLADQIQGQIAAGLLIAGFYEDKGDDALDKFTDPFIATLAVKPVGWTARPTLSSG